MGKYPQGKYKKDKYLNDNFYSVFFWISLVKLKEFYLC